MRRTRSRIALVFCATSALILFGCEKKDQEHPLAGQGKAATRESVQVAQSTFVVESPAFKPLQPIPAKYTADGENVSPPLRWNGVPVGTKEFALICQDLDTPEDNPWIHWVIYKIPATSMELSESIPKEATLQTPAGAIQGKNSWNEVGYRGPEPPQGKGAHRYRFRVYALNAPLDVQQGLDAKSLASAMETHVLAHGDRIGTYSR